MPHVSTGFTVTDGAAVSRLFDLRNASIAESLFRYARTAGDGRDKWVTFGTTFSDTTVKRPTTRVGFDFAYPVLRTESGITVVKGVGRIQSSTIVPDEMTEAEALDMFTLYRGLTVTGGTISDMIVKRLPIWG